MAANRDMVIRIAKRHLQAGIVSNAEEALSRATETISYHWQNRGLFYPEQKYLKQISESSRRKLIRDIAKVG